MLMHHTTLCLVCYIRCLLFILIWDTENFKESEWKEDLWFLPSAVDGDDHPQPGNP